jgi:Arc/MetJ family transcription regulator
MCIIASVYTHEAAMRTNIDIDDTLLIDAMRATGLATKKATVEEALRRLVRRQQQRDAITALEGIGWDGDLAMIRGGDAG